jgi:hypothetical protein
MGIRVPSPFATNAATTTRIFSHSVRPGEDGLHQELGVLVARDNKPPGVWPLAAFRFGIGCGSTPSNEHLRG